MIVMVMDNVECVEVVGELSCNKFVVCGIYLKFNYVFGYVFEWYCC